MASFSCCFLVISNSYTFLASSTTSAFTLISPSRTTYQKTTNKNHSYKLNWFGNFLNVWRNLCCTKNQNKTYGLILNCKFYDSVSPFLSLFSQLLDLCYLWICALGHGLVWSYGKSGPVLYPTKISKELDVLFQLLTKVEWALRFYDHSSLKVTLFLII